MSKNQCKGRLIVIEGGDGVGKQTVSTELYERLIYKGYPTILISFPRYYTTPGKEIRRVLEGAWGNNKEQIDPIAFGALYAWDRADAKSSLTTWLREGKLVVADRYVLSNCAHQGARKKKKRDQLSIINHFLHLEYDVYRLPKSNLNILLDTPVILSNEAMKNQRRTTDVNEKDMTYQKEVRKIFRCLHQTLKPLENNIIINCINEKGERRSRQEISDRVWKMVNERILSKF